MSFLHIADIHLGYQQYGLSERFSDFSRAFLHLVDTAVARRVDFVLLAGDPILKLKCTFRRRYALVVVLRRLWCGEALALRRFLRSASPCAFPVDAALTSKPTLPVARPSRLYCEGVETQTSTIVHGRSSPHSTA